jgi:hypothetical protein
VNLNKYRSIIRIEDAVINMIADFEYEFYDETVSVILVSPELYAGLEVADLLAKDMRINVQECYKGVLSYDSANRLCIFDIPIYKLPGFINTMICFNDTGHIKTGKVKFPWRRDR